MSPDQPSRKQGIAIAIMAAVAVGSLVLPWVWVPYQQFDTIPFSRFEQLVAEGGVTEVTVGSDTIQGKVKDKLPSGKSDFVTARVDAALAEKLAAKGVVVTGVPSGGLLQSILVWGLPALMFYLIWVFGPPPRRPTRLGRVHVNRQVTCQGLCRKGHQGHFC